MSVINLNSTADITLKTAGKYCEDDIRIVQNLEERTAIPSASEQVFEPSVDKNGMSKFVVQKTPTEQVSVKSGLVEQYKYPTNGRFIDSIFIYPMELQNKEVTPTKEDQNITADDDFDGLNSLSVKAIPDEYIIPEGNINVTENNQVIDVTQYSQATISVPSGGVGEDLLATVIQGESMAFSDPNHTITKTVGRLQLGNLRWLTLPICSTFDGYDGFAIKELSLPICTNIGDMRSTLIERVYAPNLQNLTTYAFQDCSFLREADFPLLSEVGTHAFAACYLLSSVNLPSVTSVGPNAFNNCSSLSYINLENCITMGSSVFTLLGNGLASKSALHLEFPKLEGMDGLGTFQSANIATFSAPNLERIGGYCFATCSNLTTIYAPNAYSIGSSAFRVCSLLSELTLDWSNILMLQSATFQTCNLLNGIGELAKCSIVENNCFQNCSALESISLPTCEKIGTSGFQDCKALKTISLPNCSSIGYGAFQRCTVLEAAYIPKVTSLSYAMFAFGSCTSLSYVEASALTIFSGSVFAGCTSLKSVNAPNLLSIPSNGFANCSSLEEANYPQLSYVGATGFYNTAIKSVSFPNLSYIGGSAFRSCSALSFVYLSGTLSSLYSYTFIDCSSLGTLVINTSSRIGLANSAVFNSTPFKDSTYLGYFGSIYVPTDLVDSYKTATNWTYFADRITSIDNLQT